MVRCMDTETLVVGILMFAVLIAGIYFANKVDKLVKAQKESEAREREKEGARRGMPAQKPRRPGR